MAILSNYNDDLFYFILFRLFYSDYIILSFYVIILCYNYYLSFYYLQYFILFCPIIFYFLSQIILSYSKAVSLYFMGSCSTLSSQDFISSSSDQQVGKSTHENAEILFILPANWQFEDSTHHESRMVQRVKVGCHQVTHVVGNQLSE